MPAVNPYCELQDLKNKLEIQSDERDDDLWLAIGAASRKIESWTGQKFYSTTEDRYFTADDPLSCRINPAIAINTVAVDRGLDRTYSTTLASTDWETFAGPGRPIRKIEIAPNAANVFPLFRRCVKVSADWGYSATVPDDVSAAAFLLSHRFFKRHDSIFGIAGAPAVGTLVIQSKMTMDSDIVELLRSYKRYK